MNKTLKVPKKQDIVTVEDLHMVYRVGKVEVPALQGVSLTVKKGDFLAIMGPSGCGKSTLLHIVGGLLRPTQGRIWVDGLDLAKASDSDRTEIRRRNIGFVFQRFNLLPTLTAKDNIELARRIHGADGKNSSRTEEVLGLLGLEAKINHRPYELSGGEQQRVAMARAVINQPALLLADEPTGNLDSDNSQMVLQMLQELNIRYDQTIILITHDSEVAAAASRIIEMRDGRILNRVQNIFYAMEQ